MESIQQASTDQGVSNPSYDNKDGFTTVDLDVDMFDDGHSIPDYTLRRSSSVTKQAKPVKLVKPVLKIELSEQ